ncbi:MAG: hypothetical protein ACJ761_04910 [Chloroflexota bacterium]
MRSIYLYVLSAGVPRNEPRRGPDEPLPPIDAAAWSRWAAARAEPEPVARPAIPERPQTGLRKVRPMTGHSG